MNDNEFNPNPILNYTKADIVNLFITNSQTQTPLDTFKHAFKEAAHLDEKQADLLFTGIQSDLKDHFLSIKNEPALPANKLNHLEGLKGLYRCFSMTILRDIKLHFPEVHIKLLTLILNYHQSSETNLIFDDKAKLVAVGCANDHIKSLSGELDFYEITFINQLLSYVYKELTQHFITTKNIEGLFLLIKSFDMFTISTKAHNLFLHCLQALVTNNDLVSFKKLTQRFSDQPRYAGITQGFYRQTLDTACQENNVALIKQLNRIPLPQNILIDALIENKKINWLAEINQIDHNNLPPFINSQPKKTTLRENRRAILKKIAKEQDEIGIFLTEFLGRRKAKENEFDIDPNPDWSDASFEKCDNKSQTLEKPIISASSHAFFHIPGNSSSSLAPEAANDPESTRSLSESSAIFFG